MDTRPKLGIGGLLLVFAIVAAACGETSEPSPSPARALLSTPAPAPAAGAPQEVASDIKDFTLENLTVEVGTKVVWTNRDSASHTSTSGSKGTKTGIWDSSSLAKGASFTFTFDKVGTFQYFCTIHPASMNATVTVVAGAARGASTTPQPSASGPQPSATAVPPQPTPSTGYSGY